MARKRDSSVLQETTTHIAALAITVNGRVIQRCALCGSKLLDSKYALLAGNLCWPAYRMVRVTPKGQIDLGQNLKELPMDCCLDLVER